MTPALRPLAAALLLWLAGRTAAAAEPPAAESARAVTVELRQHNGRPTIFIDGRPRALPAYSPMGFDRKSFEKQVPRFIPHKMGVYFLFPGGVEGAGDFFATPFWMEDTVADQPMGKPYFLPDEQAAFISERDPEALFIVRFGVYEPKTWKTRHPEELFVTETGERLDTPSLASDVYWEKAASLSTAIVRYCESRPFAGRVIGYANFHRTEGGHEPVFAHWLFDHGPRMTAAWRAFLTRKYRTDEALRTAHGDATLTLAAAPVPRDRLRAPLADAARVRYWLPAAQNQPLRDYLELQTELFHRRFRQLGQAMRDATPRQVLFFHDALKQTMLGWNLPGFFDARADWLPFYPEVAAGSGQMRVAELFDAPGCDGLITPHDYQARGAGGVFEPEGSVDSAVLRGEYFWCEADVRTYADKHNGYGKARDDREFAAITWRNLASGLTRGFNPYWMDLSSDWFTTAPMHRVIARQAAVLEASVDWPHRTVPGIAMVLDDTAALETNGSGHYLNEAVLWEQKMGLARCGVPFRIYLLEDLALPQFPEHRVFYLPNLFRVDDARLALLREKVFRNGHVVVWGPGSGISDGTRLSAESAAKLTGFAFDLIEANYARRTLIADFSHPLTRGLAPDLVLGGPLTYGPLLFPTDGTRLGEAWTKLGRSQAGLAVREMDGWTSVFTTAVPLPAALWRNLARRAGAHVYSESGDVVLADASIVALHSLAGGAKVLELPQESAVEDLVTGSLVARRTHRLRFTLDAPGTAVYHITPLARPVR